MALHDPPSAPGEAPHDAVHFGPGIDHTIERRLLGDVRGRRILELGCGAGHTAVGLARRGARVIAIDDDDDQLTKARGRAARAEVAIEFHQAQPAELAFLAADHIDLTIAITSLSFVEDLNRVFRQVHRVIGPGGHFVLSVPHPASLCADPADAAVTIHAWDTTETIDDQRVHTAESIVTSLGRANFAVDTVLERRDQALLPATLVVRARKLGV